MENKLMWRRLTPVLLIVPVLAVTMFALWELVDSEPSLPSVAAVPLPGTPDLDLAPAGDTPLPIASAIAGAIDQALLAVTNERARPLGESRLETDPNEQPRSAVVTVKGHGPTFFTDLPPLSGDEVQVGSAPGSRLQSSPESGAINLVTNPAPVSQGENAGGGANSGTDSGGKNSGTSGSGGNRGSGGGGNSGNGSAGDDNCDSSGSGNPCNA